MLKAILLVLSAILALGLLAACYAAAEIILPIAVAALLMLVLQPAMRFLEKLHCPRSVAALLLITMLFAIVAGLGTVLSGPVTSWAQKLPGSAPKLEERLSVLRKPIATLEQFLTRAEHMAQAKQSNAVPVAIEGNDFAQRLIETTRRLASGLVETVIVLFFLLLSGETFLRRFVEILPNFKNKRQAVEISQQIEADISAYLVTITLMNGLVGIGTGIVVALCGLGDPLLWGTFAFLLNFVPILGPIAGVVILLIAGLLSLDSFWLAVAPAALYLAIHVAEGETLTPMLLARRFTLNPVLIVVSLVFWYWMWGVPGAILATPMLAMTKIVCDRVQPLMPIGHFIEG